MSRLKDTDKLNRAKSISGFIIAFLLIFIFQQAASRAGGTVAGKLDYSSVDPENAFLWISVHHIVQMASGLVLLLILGRSGFEFYLKPKFTKTGLKYVVIFSAAVEICTVVGYLIMYKTSNVLPYSFEINLRNITGTLSFQLLLSGPSEEILFRALPVVVLGSIIKKEDNDRYMMIPVLAAALLFSAAHINWTVHPFTLSYNLLQLIYSFIFGIAYGAAYIRTRSVIYPMIMHSLSNILMVGTGYIFYAVRGAVIYD